MLRTPSSFWTRRRSTDDPSTSKLPSPERRELTTLNPPTPKEPLDAEDAEDEEEPEVDLPEAVLPVLPDKPSKDKDNNKANKDKARLKDNNKADRELKDNNPEDDDSSNSDDERTMTRERIEMVDDNRMPEDPDPLDSHELPELRERLITEPLRPPLSLLLTCRSLSRMTDSPRFSRMLLLTSRPLTS